MRLCTVAAEGVTPFFGVELKNRILRIEQAARAFELPEKSQAYFRTSLDYFANLPASEKALRNLLKAVTEKPRQLAKPAGDGQPYLFDRAKVTYLPPIQRPGKILCIGQNYRDHCVEQNKEIPTIPMVFNKFATSLLGHGATVPLPVKVDDHIDYEAELVVVIGKTATRVTKRAAMKHVAGYTMMNDVSLREIQKKERQWSRAKGWDGSGPCGPVIVTADEIPNPHDLGISCHLNGKVVQKSNTSNLIFDIPTLISFITQLVTLEPGD
ncbi:FAA hydrolase family protein, partial [bacterium]|nr:FAA hydrolase family protein [bacterium]